MVYRKLTQLKSLNHSMMAKTLPDVRDIGYNLPQAIATSACYVAVYVYTFLVFVTLGHKKWCNLSLITVRASFQ